MDLHQLYNFLVLSEVKNVTKAAKTLSLTQSELSKSIARLEEEMGVPLFERNPRGVILNQYGIVFLEYAERAIKEMRDAQNKIKEMIDPEKGVISIGFIPSLRPKFIPNLIHLFSKRNPNVQFRLSQEPTQRLIKQLISTEIDLAFCSPQPDIENVNSFPIINEELFLIVPKKHTLAGRKNIDLSEVSEERFVHYQSGLPLKSVIDEYCQQAGFLPKIEIEGSEDEIVAGLVAANCGVALIPLTPGIDKSKVSILRVKKPTCRRTIEMLWRTNGYMSPTVKQLKYYITENISLLKS
jgi:DNA-binding transcriptional LysR family regulator